MRYFIPMIVLCGIVAWLLTPQPVTPPVAEAGASPTQTTAIKPRPADGPQLENALAAGKLHQDPQRRALRQSIMNAASRVEASPCDPQARQLLADAVEAFNRLVTGQEQVETFTASDGAVVESTPLFNEPVQKAVWEAERTDCDTGGSDDEPHRRLPVLHGSY